MYDKTGHRRPPGDFILHGLYGFVINSGKSFFTNNPSSHSESIGLPQGHPSLISFLGVPLILDRNTKGILAVANREGGYSLVQQEDLEAIAPAVTQALERKKVEQERKYAEEALKEAYQSLEDRVRERTAELEKAYNSLKESEESLAEAQRIAHIGNWDWNIVTNKVYWSDETYCIFGLDPQKLEATFDLFFSYVHPDDRNPIENAVEKALKGESYSIDYRLVLPSGERTVHSYGKVIFDNKNIPIRMKGTTQDITERKKAEESLENMKEISIKEIHHRIKNNLQVISSLLDLQIDIFSNREICKTPEVIEAFRESQNRVVSVALIHEELYKSKGMDSLDFAAYLQKLTKNFLKSYNIDADDINLKLDFEQVYLGMDTAVPLGIIVNELFSNSLKHAFPNKREREIKITLQKEENVYKKASFHYMLTVTDNGKGIPEEIDIQTADSLGLQLVNILVEQIDGCIELKRNKGTEFTIWFNNIEK